MQQGFKEQDRVTTLPQDKKAPQSRSLKDETVKFRKMHEPGLKAWK